MKTRRVVSKTGECHSSRILGCRRRGLWWNFYAHVCVGLGEGDHPAVPVARKHRRLGGRGYAHCESSERRDRLEKTNAVVQRSGVEKQEARVGSIVAACASFLSGEREKCPKRLLEGGVPSPLQWQCRFARWRSRECVVHYCVVCARQTHAESESQYCWKSPIRSPV